MNDQAPKARIKDVKPLCDGFLKVSEYRIEAGRHDGGTQEVVRSVMERGHAVAVLAYDPARDLVVLVNEMRSGILVAGEYPYTDTLIAGGIKDGETAIDAAIAETKEETGLDLLNPVLVHAGAYVSPGGTSEKIAIVAGTVDASLAGGIHGAEGESEDIKTVVLTVADFLARVKVGEITDLKTLVAGYWLEVNRQTLRAAPAFAARRTR